MDHRKFTFAWLIFFGALFTSAPVFALPIIFTDRAAFNAAVGDTTLLTLDTLPPSQLNPEGGSNLFRFIIVENVLRFDGEGLFGSSVPGTFCFCSPSGFEIGGITVDPVLAIGMDITPILPPGTTLSATIILGGQSFVLTEPQFLGFLYTGPSIFGISQGFRLPGGFSTFTIDNVAIKTAPEPSSVILVALAVIGLITWRLHAWRFTKSQLLSVGFVMLSMAVPLLAEASPISPNPNPVGSTIDIINDPTASTGVDPLFLNAGTINNDASSKLTISAPLANAGTLNNYGQVSQLNITNTGTINNFGGFNDVGNYGTLTNAVGATLNNYGGIVMGPLGPALIANAGTLNNYAGSSIIGTFGGGNMSNTGTLNNFANATVAIYDGGFGNAVGATINNSGTMIAFLMTNDGTLNNAGIFTCCTSGEVFINSVGATIINSGVMVLCCHAFGNGGTVLNTGTINTPQIFNGGTLVNNGTMNTDFNLASNEGLLRGNGTLNADLTHMSGGLLAPGDSSVLGKFTIHGNLESSGDFLFRIQGLNVGQFDVLDIGGDAAFTGGKVSFAFSGFDPKIGNSWDFLYASAISGWDSLTFVFSGLDTTERAQFFFHDGIQSLRIVAVPEPASILLLGAGLAGVAVFRRRS